MYVVVLRRLSKTRVLHGLHHPCAANHASRAWLLLGTGGPTGDGMRTASSHLYALVAAFLWLLGAASLHLCQLGLHLRRGLGLVHALAHEDVHKKHLLLLHTLVGSQLLLLGLSARLNVCM